MTIRPRGHAPADIKISEGFPLEQCYRFVFDGRDTPEAVAANVHLLAAFGNLKEPLVPLRKDRCGDKKAWEALPHVTDVKLTRGRILHEQDVWFGTLTCVDSLSITVRTSDGKTFSSAVPMAAQPRELHESYDVLTELYVTPDARSNDFFGAIWFHLGGVWEEGDTPDRQQEDFDAELEQFWASLDGTDKTLR